MMPENEARELGNRREFLKKAVVRAGVAFAVPAILSTVRPTDLAARVSGGSYTSPDSSNPTGGNGSSQGLQGPPAWKGGRPPWAGGPGGGPGR